MARKETTTVPGLINLGVLLFASCAAFITGALGTFETVAAVAEGEQRPALTLVLAFVLGIAILIALIMCVWILTEAEKS